MSISIGKLLLSHTQTRTQTHLHLLAGCTGLLPLTPFVYFHFIT